MSAARKKSRRRLLLAVAVIPCLFAPTAFWIYGNRVAALSRMGAGFTPVQEFPLRDSLPALAGGLSNLEAFRASIKPVRNANADRSIWVSDSIGTITLDYVTGKTPFDSVVLMSWTTGNNLETQTFHDRRDISWTIRPTRDVMKGWSEVVAAYTAFPPLITFRTIDTSSTLFQEIEGTVLHIVKGHYLSRREQPLAPDTTYPLIDTAGVLRILARGQAIALVNPESYPVRLRLLGLADRSPPVIGASAKHISVYRHLRTGQEAPLLAFTNPGQTYPVFQEPGPEPQKFFVLMNGF